MENIQDLQCTHLKLEELRVGPRSYFVDGSGVARNVHPDDAKALLARPSSPWSPYKDQFTGKKLEHAPKRRAIPQSGFTPEVTTCPMRAKSGEQNTMNMDRWEIAPNTERRCSHCGSIHPAEFLALLPAVQDGKVDFILSSDSVMILISGETRPTSEDQGPMFIRTDHLPRDLLQNRLKVQEIDEAIRASMERALARSEEGAKTDDDGSEEGGPKETAGALQASNADEPKPELGAPAEESKKRGPGRPRKDAK